MAAASSVVGKTSRINVSQTSILEQERQKSFAEEDSPPSFEHHPLAWEKFNDEEVEKLKKLTPPELERMLATTLNLTDYKISLIDGAKVDFFVGGFLFAKEEDFDNFQTSCLMGLLKKILQNCESRMSLKKNVEQFISYFTGIKIEGSKDMSGMERFNVEQAKKIMDFTHQGIFQHYKLFQNLFLNEQEERTLEKTLEIEVLPAGELPFPAPLHEGMPLELYEKYVAPPEPSLEVSETTQDTNENNENMAENSTDKGQENLTERPKSEKENAAEMILKSLKPEEIKQIVTKMAQETLGVVKAEADSKIKEKEAVIVSKLNKLHLT